jgi:hypothetical protein
MHVKWTLHCLLLKMDERECIYENNGTSCGSEEPHMYITVLDNSDCVTEEIYEEVETEYVNGGAQTCGNMLNHKQILKNVLQSGNVLMKNPKVIVKTQDRPQKEAEHRLSRYISEEEYITPNVPVIQLEDCCSYGNVSDDEEAKSRRSDSAAYREEIEILYGNCIKEFYHLQGRFICVFGFIIFSSVLFAWQMFHFDSLKIMWDIVLLFQLLF